MVGLYPSGIYLIIKSGQFIQTNGARPEHEFAKTVPRIASVA